MPKLGSANLLLIEKLRFPTRSTKDFWKSVFTNVHIAIDPLAGSGKQMQIHSATTRWIAVVLVVMFFTSVINHSHSLATVSPQDGGIVRQISPPQYDPAQYKSAQSDPLRRPSQNPASTNPRSRQDAANPMDRRLTDRRAANLGSVSPSMQRQLAQADPSFSQNTAPAEAFPYTLIAAKNSVAVRSGPSSNDYPTDLLPVGSEVQIWRHDPDGWMAIRPPPGSFSLVRSDDLQATNQRGIYQVIRERVKAWVGTRVDQDHNPMSQVRLKQGELLAVTSSIVVEADGKSQPWFQVEPPAGEFRWVHVSDLAAAPGRTNVASNATPRSLPNGNSPSTRTQTNDAVTAGQLNATGANANTNTGVNLVANATTPLLQSNEFASNSDQPWTTFIPGENSNVAQNYPNTQATQFPAPQAFANPSANAQNFAAVPTNNSIPFQPHSNLDPVDFPSLDLENTTLAGAGDLGQEELWRAAQQVTPELDYGDNVLGNQSPDANPLQTVQGRSATGTTQAQMLQAGYRQDQGSGNGSGSGNGFNAMPATVPQEPAAAQQWDQALLQLRQSSIGKTSADSNPPTPNTASGLVSPNPFNPPNPNPSSNLQSFQTMFPGNDWNQQFNLVNSLLSQEVQKPVQQWNLANLLQQAEVLRQFAPSRPQQQVTVELQQRIQGFLQLQRTQPGANDLTAGVGNSRFASANGFVYGAAPANNPVQPVTGLVENPYDAVGYLKELVLQRGKQPNAFVLQDINGKSLCHVSGQPGVNLHQYLDLKVGVIGAQGFHSQLKLPHVTVERVQKLE